MPGKQKTSRRQTRQFERFLFLRVFIWSIQRELSNNRHDQQSGRAARADSARFCRYNSCARGRRPFLLHRRLFRGVFCLSRPFIGDRIAPTRGFHAKSLHICISPRPIGIPRQNAQALLMTISARATKSQILAHTMIEHAHFTDIAVAIIQTRQTMSPRTWAANSCR